MIPKVKQMTSKGGNLAANQYIITTSEGRYFQSYGSTIALVPEDGGQIELGTDWNASRTTSRYRTMFLGETTKETKQNLLNGTYTLNENL